MIAARVVVDADILSMFAKADALEWVEELAGRGRAVMTPAIQDEISVPLQYGYAFPKAVLSRIPVVPLTRQAWREYEHLRAAELPLGRGEVEAIAFCKAEGAFFATNDTVARRIAQSHGVRVLSLQAILRGMWHKGLRSKAEVRKLLGRIQEVDYLEVPPEVEREIFGE